jgi:DNA repair ATPase RecN
VIEFDIEGMETLANNLTRLGSETEQQMAALLQQDADLTWNDPVHADVTNQLESAANRMRGAVGDLDYIATNLKVYVERIRELHRLR